MRKSKRTRYNRRVGSVVENPDALPLFEAVEGSPIEVFISRRRIARIDDVLARRTRNLALLLEDVFDPHNAAACLRSADAFGVQDVHVVETDTVFAPKKRIVQGADRWLDLHRYPDTASCLGALRSAGYRIYASDLSATCSLDEIDFSQPTVLAFGGEHVGASAELVSGADGTFIIPMRGFSQSLNVSVAVAISLYHAVHERIRGLGPEGDLDPEDRARLRERFLQTARRRGEIIAEALGT